MAKPLLLPLTLCFLLFLFFNGSLARRNRQFQQQNQCQLDQIQAREPDNRIEAEAGLIESWNPNNDELQCAGVAVLRWTVEPNGLHLPSYSNAPQLIYIVKGNGVLGVVFPGCPETFEESQQQGHRSKEDRSSFREQDRHQKVRYFREGDIIAIPVGVAYWTYNNGDSSFVAVTLLDTNNNENQLDQNPRRFYLAGNPDDEFEPQQQGRHQQSRREQSPWERSRREQSPWERSRREQSPWERSRREQSPREQREQRGEQESSEGNNIFSGFKTKLLAEALNIDIETARKLQSQNDNRNNIVRVKGRLDFITPQSSREEREREEGGEREREGGEREQQREEESERERMREQRRHSREGVERGQQREEESERERDREQRRHSREGGERGQPREEESERERDREQRRHSREGGEREQPREEESERERDREQRRHSREGGEREQPREEESERERDREQRRHSREGGEREQSREEESERERDREQRRHSREGGEREQPREEESERERDREQRRHSREGGEREQSREEESERERDREQRRHSREGGEREQQREEEKDREREREQRRHSREGGERKQQREEEKDRERDREQRRHSRCDRPNGLEETFCSLRLKENIGDPSRADIFTPQAGRLRSVNSFNLPILSHLRLSAERGVLYNNGIYAPHWNLNAHSIVYVIRGRARTQIVDENGNTLLDNEVRQGQLFVIPQNHAVLTKAGNEGFEYIAFKTNENAQSATLVGKLSFFRALPESVLANAFQVSREEAKKLKYNTEESTLFSSRGYSSRSRSSSGEDERRAVA